MNVGTSFHIQFLFFVCHDGFTASNVTEQGKTLCRDWDDVIKLHLWL